MLSKRNKNSLSIPIILVIVFLAFYWMFFYSNSLTSNSDLECQAKLIELSSLLNQAMNKIGRLSCEASTNQVSEQGGWCSKISGSNSTHHMTDVNFENILSKFLTGKRVASFGDGPGVYKQILDKLGQVASYTAFDGAPYSIETSDGRVSFLDLSVPIYHLVGKYDWIVSVEVAEHIPKQFEQIYIDNLVRHAKEGIILGWAVEGQGGTSHVNNRNFDYVKKQIEAKRFLHDVASSKLLQENSSFDWIRRNVNVFRKV